MRSRLTTDRFQLIDLVGYGKMGTVWRAWDNRIDREVAVKVIKPPGLNDTDSARACQRTMQEAEAAARIRHPGIAAVHDVFVADDGIPWIVTESVAGRPLDDVIDAFGPLPPPVVAAIGIYVLGALAAAHREQVIHRDLQPANIVITPDRRAVLTDFGIATLADGPAPTQPGVFAGTPGFAAPERMRGMSTPATDLWSFGATLYAAVSGRAPYADYADSTAAFFAVVAGEPPPLPASAPLRDLISALMSPYPADRPDAVYALRALTEFAARLGQDGAAAAEAWWAEALADSHAHAIGRRHG
jgi:eukaryotic-like serine/threonine-protein kinase